MRLIIPFACCQSDACHQALAKLRLPALERLLNTLVSQHADAGSEYTLSPPHERARAATRGMSAPDGQIAWGAWRARALGLGEPGNAWALVTPCHWHVGSDQIAMRGLGAADAYASALGADQSEALCATLQPWFAGDGIELVHAAPGEWLARGSIFSGLATASVDRVMGRSIDAWMPEGLQAAPLRRLQNEAQMLLYNHPVNDDRAAAGLPPVNSFWLSGTGALPATAAEPAVPTRYADALRLPALAEDWAAWSAAWQTLDATECAPLAERAAAGEPVELVLCGERAAQTFGRGAGGLAGLWRQISGMFGRQSASSLVGLL